MCARYRMVRNPNPTGEKKKQALHPRVVPLGTLHTDDLIEEVENRSGISGADIKGALRVLADVVADRLEQGYNVEVENFGFLSVSLSSWIRRKSVANRFISRMSTSAAENT